MLEFKSTQPVVHIDIPEGRYLIIVRCAQGVEPVATPPCKGRLH